ncbi:uncharacterized protein LOC119070360 [Bradysia coprophila]|uniref:uncharacterized protein LOC119070360 n=1 Tax=Bradysia coprophila TaxID=38358 RepID=UPI00187DC332|nr:uncharacterized protein LOC119070360 [Bradysia coprophila]
MVDKFISMWKVRELADKVTNVVMNYTEIEGKVREATNDEQWGPTGQIMQELAHATFTYEHFPEVMSMLWKRMLQDNKTNWRRTYKSLLLLNYLVRNGSERVVTSSREHIYDLRSLENYTFTDENGKDQGINVRHKVRELIDFIQDDDKLREERKKAKKNKDKYIGMSADAMGMRMGGSTGSYNDNWDSSRRSGGADRSGGDRHGDRNWYSENRSRGDYEDDYQYDGEREDSDVESSEPPTSARRYRDKDRSSPVSSSYSNTDRKPQSTINVTVNPKNPVITKAPLPKSAKKIDMGAATNFGKSDLGINSPTHRNTHAEEDLFSADSTPSNNNNNTKPTENMFKTCSPSPTNIKNDNRNELDFNPREDENEFGDFASAFGSVTLKDDVPKDDFADFSNVFAQPAAPTSNNANNLLLDPSPMSMFGQFTNNPVNLMSPSTLYQPQPQQQQPQPASDLLSDFGGLTFNAPVSNALNNDSIQPKTPQDTDIGIHSKLRNILRNIQTATALRSTNDMQRFEQLMVDFINQHPGSLTPEKVMRIDEAIYVDWKSIAVNEYSQCLEAVLHRVDRNWPNVVGGPSVFQQLFTVDCNAEFVMESVTTLATNLSKNCAVLLHVLSNIINSETALFTTFLDLSYNDDGLSETNKNLLEKRCEDFIQILVSLPSRVANEMRQLTPDEFLTDGFSRIVLSHILKTVSFACNVNSMEARPVFNGTFITKLLSKVITNFHMERTSKPIVQTIKALASLSNQSPVMMQFVSETFIGLSRQAIDIIAVFILKHIPNVQRILGPNAISRSANWKQCLLVTIPFLNFFRDPNICINFVRYLCDVDEAQLMDTLLLELVSTWASKISICRTSIDQHIYLSSLILLIVHSKKRSDETKFKEILFRGVQQHIDSQNSSIRCIGMILTELVLNKIDSFAAEEKLQFDYTAFDSHDKEIIADLNRLCGLYDNQQSSEDVFDDEEIIIQRKPEQLIRPQSNQILKVNEELDSDDDLESYDMSNDVPVVLDKAPKYLQDLKELICETDDPNIFASCLENGRDLILEQLPNDDALLGLDLLRILIGLDQKFYMTNFEEHRLSSCVAICTVYPKECVEYICGEFNSEVGRYSLANKILMLEIIAESAKELSSLETASSKLQTKTKSSDNHVKKLSNPLEDVKIKETERIIRDRIEKKSKRFATKSTHLLKHAQQNRFAPFAGNFFYSLLHGFGKHQLTLTSSKSLKHDIDNILLINFLQTLTTIVLAARNCIIVTKFAKDILLMCSMLRFNDEAKIRLVVLQMYASVLITVPRWSLHSEFFDDLCEMKVWLEACCQFNVIKREQNDECREMAEHVLVLCLNVLSTN